MKKTFLFACGIAMCCCSCVQGSAYVVKQDINWLAQRFNNEMTVDSVSLKTEAGTKMFRSGEFFYQDGILQFTGEISEPTVVNYDFYITSPKYTGKASGVNFVLEPGSNIEVVVEGSVYAAKGTPTNDDYYEFNKRMVEAYQSKVVVFEDAIKDLFAEYVDKHANDISAVLYLTDRFMTSELPADLWLKGYEKCNKTVQKRADVQKSKATVEVVFRTAEGQPFVDFTVTYEGKEQKLSDYVGKGKYVLVDFWASWCGPCKAEIPNLIAVYNKYKGEKFEVLGVATWDKPEDTLKAMEALGITYPQIMNAQREGSSAYGITGIPQIILFGPDGTILKRDLRGEQIEKTVASYLK